MQEEGYIVYSDYMGSGPGNKASDGGGRGYIRAGVVATWLFHLFLSLSLLLFLSLSVSSSYGGCGTRRVAPTRGRSKRAKRVRGAKGYRKGDT